MKRLVCFLVLTFTTAVWASQGAPPPGGRADMLFPPEVSAVLLSPQYKSALTRLQNSLGPESGLRLSALAAYRTAGPSNIIATFRSEAQSPKQIFGVVTYGKEGEIASVRVGGGPLKWSETQLIARIDVSDAASAFFLSAKYKRALSNLQRSLRRKRQGLALVSATTGSTYGSGDAIKFAYVRFEKSGRLRSKKESRHAMILGTLMREKNDELTVDKAEVVKNYFAPKPAPARFEDRVALRVNRRVQDVDRGGRDRRVTREAKR